MNTDSYVIGIDFGTDSVRAVIVNARNGEEKASSVSYYKRWSQGLYCVPSKNQFRQHPLDYLEALTDVVISCLQKAGKEISENITGLSVATTGSTPVAVDESGTPLSLLPSFSENPDAMFVLWKDHTSINEADQINQAASMMTTDYLKYVGGAYSSEWYWAKLLHVLRNNEEIRNACFTWVEHSDWIPFLLTGGKSATDIKRNICAAGHKGMWADEFGGMPSVGFFRSVDELLVPYVSRFGNLVYHAGQSAGKLSEEWAQKFGLHTNVEVGIGALDAHIGAVGGGVKPFYLSKVMGTSTCDMMVIPRMDMEGVFIKGISGQVENSIIPGMIGLEAGQSAFGDVYSWFKKLLLWPLASHDSEDSEFNSMKEKVMAKIGRDVLGNLDKLAESMKHEDVTEFALDWLNGRRTPFANPNVKGLVGGLTLGSDAPAIYRALVEATCFGSKAIVDSIEEQGIHIEGVMAMGGITSKSAFVVQMMADVLNRPVQVSPVEQTVALGAAMFAAVVSGIYQSVEDALKNMGNDSGKKIFPDQKSAEWYAKRYETYLTYGKMQQ